MVKQNTVRESAVEYGLTAKTTNFERTKINSSKIASDYIRQFYKDDLNIYESFFMIALSADARVKGFCKISQGGINGTVVDKRLVCKYAIETLSTAIIIAHNHPSGNLMPSKADRIITEEIKKALNLFNINLFDHIIITKDDHLSFADEGLI